MIKIFTHKISKMIYYKNRTRGWDFFGTIRKTTKDYKLCFSKKNIPKVSQEFSDLAKLL